MEKYSVLMTVYKKDNPVFFSLALDSMIHQSYPPDEIVLVKDGPIVESLQSVIDSHKSEGAPIVEVQLAQNVGLGLALNAGIRTVRNELIARMDSDDYSLPTRCEKWSSCYVSPDGYKTGAWLRGQLRIAQRNGIDPRRRDMLSAIGVEF